LAVSSDGVVTATVDATTPSIKLVVDFTATGSAIKATAATTVYTVTVTEQTTGQQVRGISSAPGGAIVGIDGEAPFATGLSYVAKAFGVTGNLLATSTAAAITLPVPATGMGTWLKSLATPSLSCNVTTQTLPTWEDDIAQGVIRVKNRPDPIVVSDVRQFDTGTLTVVTKSAAAEAALLALLKSSGPYLLQMPNAGTADRYVTVGKVSRSRPSNQFSDSWRVWTLPLTQVVRPPVVGWSVAVPGKTYADTQAAAPLYSNRTGTYLLRSS